MSFINHLYNISSPKIASNRLHIFLFLVIILGISWFFHYFEIFHFVAHGPHQWRQSDSCSFVQNYYNNGLDFFKPQVHHNISGEGFGSPSEFPILYYLTALIWSWFSPHDGVLRIINYLILIVGYFSLFKLSFHLTKDLFYALAVPLILMGSPVMAFYGFNYIPNIPALGLTFSGTLFFYYFFQTENSKWLVASCSTFLLAGLLKVTVLIPFICIILIFLIEKSNLVKFKKEGYIFQKGWINLLLFSSVFAIIALWILWVKNYNTTHNCTIFITKTRPIWSLVEPAITETWHWIIKEGAPKYYHWVSRYTIFGLGFLMLFIFKRRQPNLLYGFNLLLFLGTLGTFLVFYRQFFFHEYYVIELMVFPASVLTTTFYMLKNEFPKIGNSLWTKILISIFIIFNLFHAKNSIEKRYEDAFVFNQDYEVSFQQKQKARDFLKNLGIEYPQVVISIPDESPNFHLNYFNLKGWNEYAIPGRPFEPWVFESFNAMGADYLIVTDKNYLKHNHLKDFIQYPLGNFENSIFVFDLRPLKKKTAE